MKITRIDTTSDGHLYVEVDFGDTINDFLFPDTDDAEVIRRVIRDWRSSHSHVGDLRSPIILTGECRVPELLGSDCSPAPFVEPEIRTGAWVENGRLYLDGHTLMSNAAVPQFDEFAQRVKGAQSVLLAGLGLGILANMLDVEHIDIIEIRQEIIDLIPVKTNVTVWLGDALNFRPEGTWDAAFYDLPATEDNAKLVERNKDVVAYQDYR